MMLSHPSPSEQLISEGIEFDDLGNCSNLSAPGGRRTAKRRLSRIDAMKHFPLGLNVELAIGR